MKNSDKQPTNDIPAILMEILDRSTLPLSTRELATRMRFRRLRLADYEISGFLRGMADEGSVEYKKGRWSVSSNRLPQRTRSNSRVIFPRLSEETLKLLGQNFPKDCPDSPCENSPINGNDDENTEPDAPSERWEMFRKLLGYYRECIRNEEGADASAFQNEHGKQFIYLRKSGPWYPRPGLHWRTTLPIGDHFAPLLNLLPADDDSQSLVIGYPVQAYYKEKEDEPDVAIIRPIFFYTVEHNVSGGGLTLSSPEPKPEINLGWLDYAFSRKPDQQRNFLSACGFINRWRPNDEIPGLEKGELAPSLETLLAALTAFMPERVKQPLTLHDIPGEQISEPFETGIYNRAVLMLAKRTRYTETLLKELAFIQKMPDEYLEQTALPPIFARNRAASDEQEKPLFHESIVADTTLLNAEQRHASASMLTKGLTVVTGPPGTGKSQVVSCTMQNARLRGQTVLFASRNHKAIDAVMGRLQDEQGRSLIVRTNSKDDPGLKITFGHAIQKMLAEHGDTAELERLGRAKEELKNLLEERGIEAGHAREIEAAGMALGELEDQLSYLGKDLPEKMQTFLEESPETFTHVAVQKTIKIIEDLSNHSANPGFSKKIKDFLKACVNWRLFVQAQRILQDVPDCPSFPGFPSRERITAIQPQLGLLQKSVKYCGLRKGCRPYENTIAGLPSLESTTRKVADISHRIADLAEQAVSLDIIARQGLPNNVDREELNGLRGALNAMQTGLAEGRISRKTFETLRERIPHILHAFPCWAVTNLSAGSRIPFVPGMFDLAIIDEASQCDIPSAIPILFRARRIGVVGDPFQLSHASRLSTGKDTMLRRKVEMKRVEDVRFAYTENSLYDLLAATRDTTPIFLSETYRSANEIAGYSNTVFYEGRLRIATDLAGLRIPSGLSAGIHWTEVVGEVKSGGGSGCYCPQEVEAIVGIIRVMLLENNFQGSVGVVTPFRQQANRLRDALFEGDAQFYEALTKARLHVDTAHGFQGDERDVMVFSLSAGPDMPRGSKSFLRESGNLFNVAVSRARAVMHVVGNRDWAKRCGIPHVEKLVGGNGTLHSTIRKGPWHPHESPWEEKLYKVLEAAGLKPRPQYLLSSRRLDMALIGSEENSIKIDIEVDGDCHRNADGSRKMDDLWRDIQVQGMGWKVMRFWTYQLREDMDGCVKKIMEVWKGND